MTPMSVDKQALAAKILELHPDIDAYGLDLTVAFDRDKNAWYVRLDSGDNAMATFVETRDAEECLKGTSCLYLGFQLGRFVDTYCKDPDACSPIPCH